MSKTTRKRANRTLYKWERTFEGKIDNFESKEEEVMQRKHLKAYLRGDTRFKNGKKTVTDMGTGKTYQEDNWLPVRQTLIKKPRKKQTHENID
jgi:hypothetical protein